MADSSTREKKKRGRSLRRTLSGRLRRSKSRTTSEQDKRKLSDQTTTADDSSNGSHDATQVSLAAPRRSVRRLMTSFKRKGRHDSSHSDKSAASSPSEAKAHVQRLSCTADRVIWALDHGRSTVSLFDAHINEVNSLELEAFRSYAIVKLKQLLPSSDDWSDPNLVSRDSGRNSSINSFLKKLRSRGELFMSGTPPPSTQDSPSRFFPSTSDEEGCMFALPLDKVVTADRKRLNDLSIDIPRIVTLLINQLLADGLVTHGIFRVNGNSRRVHQLAEAFDRGEEPDLTTVAPPDVASLLKLFLRQLPEPLLTWQLYSAFIQVPGLPESKQLSALQHLCVLLPASNRHVTQALLQLLAQIAQHSEGDQGNQMNVHNLAVVMAPNVLKPDPKHSKRTRTAIEYPTMEHESIACLEILIRQCDHVFTITKWHRDGMLSHHNKTSPNLVYTLTKGLSHRKDSLRPPTPPDSMSPSPVETPERPSTAPCPPQSQLSASKLNRQHYSHNPTTVSTNLRVSIAVSEFSAASEVDSLVGAQRPMTTEDMPGTPSSSLTQPQQPVELTDSLLACLGQAWDEATDKAREALEKTFAIDPAPFSSATVLIAAAEPVVEAEASELHVVEDPFGSDAEELTADQAARESGAPSFETGGLEASVQVSPTYAGSMQASHAALSSLPFVPHQPSLPPSRKSSVATVASTTSNTSPSRPFMPRQSSINQSRKSSSSTIASMASGARSPRLSAASSLLETAFRPSRPSLGSTLAQYQSAIQPSAASSSLAQQQAASATQPSLEPRQSSAVGVASIQGLARSRSRRRSSIRRKSFKGSGSIRRRSSYDAAKRIAADGTPLDVMADMDTGYVDVDDDNGTYV
eukprot:TRINITY_DN11975_c0_g3_i5.p2 TRINITY_DN11975_c0_g3~~TRINITY_DN11975_c0_g3_i5.p2  ORF type:complete len:861 (+),score=151.32 TRINITY_DN11975_c0_g3_i5:3038-5620(+)